MNDDPTSEPSRIEHTTMGQIFYRRLILLFAIWATMCISTVLLPFLSRQPQAEFVRLFSLLLAVGYALVPISVTGLWNLRRWGFVVLMIGTLLVMISYPQGILLHVICIFVTLLRYYQVKLEALSETSPTEQQAP